MITNSYDTRQLNGMKKIAWLIAVGCMIGGFNYLNQAITFVLVKLYEFLIQHFSVML